MSQCLPQLQAHVLRFQDYVLLVFYTDTDTYDCSIFISSFIPYHQIHIHTHTKYVLQMS